MIYSLWHGHLLPLLYHHRDQGVVVLISEHGDGEIIARIATNLGYRTVRGSTSRGAARALARRWRASSMRVGTLAVTPDGPRGPAKSFAPGVAIVAQRTRAPVDRCSGIREMGVAAQDVGSISRSAAVRESSGRVQRRRACRDERCARSGGRRRSAARGDGSRGAAGEWLTGRALSRIASGMATIGSPRRCAWCCRRPNARSAASSARETSCTTLVGCRRTTRPFPQSALEISQLAEPARRRSPHGSPKACWRATRIPRSCCADTAGTRRWCTSD